MPIRTYPLTPAAALTAELAHYLLQKTRGFTTLQAREQGVFEIHALTGTNLCTLTPNPGTAHSVPTVELFHHSNDTTETIEQLVSDTEKARVNLSPLTTEKIIAAAQEAYHVRYCTQSLAETLHTRYETLEFSPLNPRNDAEDMMIRECTTQTLIPLRRVLMTDENDHLLSVNLCQQDTALAVLNTNGWNLSPEFEDTLNSIANQNRSDQT